MRPSADLASTGYYLANPEREFLVFLPQGDFATVDLSTVKGSVRAEWTHPVEGTIVPGGTAPGEKPLQFDVPFIEQWCFISFASEDSPERPVLLNKQFSL